MTLENLVYVITTKQLKITNWGRYKVAANFLTISNAFQHWFRWCYHNQWWLVYRRIYASPSLNELKWKPNSPVVNELTKFGTTLSSTQCCEITLDDNAKSTIGNHYIIYSRYIAVQYNTILHTPQLWRYNFGHTSGTHERHQYLALTGELWVSFVSYLEKSNREISEAHGKTQNNVHVY